MAKKCYYLTYVNCAGAGGSLYVCSENVEYVSGGSCGGGYFNSADLGYNVNNASEQAGTVTEVSCINCPGCCTDPLDLNQKFDCINGHCVPAGAFHTPGAFANLSACQDGCSNNNPCNGECVSSAEIAALQQAANFVRPHICGL